MSTTANKLNQVMISGKPAVLVPISVWEKMRQDLEDLREDQEMFGSKTYQAKIAKARKSKRFYSAAEAKKLLGV